MFAILLGLPFVATIVAWGGWVLALPLVAAAARIAASLVEMLVPVFRAMLEGAIWYLGKLWEGLQDIADNYATILTVLTVVAVGYGYIANEHRQETRNLQSQIETLQKQKQKTVCPGQRGPYKGITIKKDTKPAPSNTFMGWTF